MRKWQYFKFLIIFLALFLLVEVVFSTLLYAGLKLPKIHQFYVLSTGYYSNCSLKFDSVSGYRITDSFRIFKISNNTLLYDQVIIPNKQGYHSKLNFTKSKTNKRFIVFGDSQTGSIYLDSTWVDDVNSMSFLKDSNTVEYYSFAQDGAGIGNWHSIFFNEVVPKYEFDGVVIAVFGNDLERNPIVFHQDTQYTYIGNLDTLNIPNAAFEKHYLPNFYKEENIVTNQQADSLIMDIGKTKNEFGLNLINYIVENIHNAIYNYGTSVRMKRYLEKFIWNEKEQQKTYSDKYFKTKYGANFERLTYILDYCKANNKEVIFCTVPESYGISLNKKGKKTIIQEEILYLSKFFNVISFDGYKAFVEYDNKYIESCFLPYDGHFNRKGASTFAKEFFLHERF